MYVCPNCGGDLKFDINEKKLRCAYCDSLFDPEDPRLTENETVVTEAGKEASGDESGREASDEIQVTIFTCPQCGAEIFSEENDATAFCSYCGASNVLSARLAGVKRPARIIPFKITKEECRAQYRKLAKKAAFSPRIFRDDSYLDRMRPLYVPYWLYSVEMDGTAEFTGIAEDYSGATITESTDRLTCRVSGSCDNIPFDASAAFDDTIAKRIAPFDMAGAEEFTTAYLAGAYANVPDVEQEVYHDDALNRAADRLLASASKSGTFRDHFLYSGPEPGTSRGSGLPVKEEKAETALFPVWFLSFRQGDRVAYAAINGQSGKMSCDFPVSVPKFLIFSFLLALPLFAVLNLFVTMKPFTGLMISCFLALLVLLIFSRNYEVIRQRDLHEGDKGYQSAGAADETGSDGDFGPLISDPIRRFYERRKANYLRQKRLAKEKKSGFFTGWALRILAVLPFLALALYFFAISAPYLVLLSAFLAGARSAEQLRGHIVPEAAGLFLSVLCGAFVLIIYPISDIWFYGASILVLAAVILSLLRIIRQYNLLATRPLPQLKGVKTEKAYRKRKTAAGMILLFLLVSGSLIMRPFPGTAASGNEYVYVNPDTGYSAQVWDLEDLLTDEGEASLLEYMVPLTEYGHALFLSDSVYNDFETAAEARYHEYLGWDNGTMFMFNTGIRELGLTSFGQNAEIISPARASVISDNVYSYAFSGDYYSCAAEAFYEVNILLSGGRISQPMKYINNALLALIAAILINYLRVNLLARGTRPFGKELTGGPETSLDLAGFRQEGTLATAARFSLGLLVFRILLMILEAALRGGGSSGGGGGGRSGGGGGSHGSSGSHKY